MFSFKKKGELGQRTVQRVKRIEMYHDMCDDCWVYELSVKEMVEKYRNTTDDLMASEYDIAYTNSRGLEVGNPAPKGLGKTDKYEVGDELVCKLLFFRSDGGYEFKANQIYFAQFYV